MEDTPQLLKQSKHTAVPFIVPLVVWTITLIIVSVLHIHRIRIDTRQLALSQSRSFFKQIVLARRWNAMHGGVYVFVTPENKPNPWLKDPDRDLVTTDGRKLTKINPAYMTRQIAELALQSEGVRFHITSSRPIRPANAPDPWERNALAAFEHGTPEQFALLQNEPNRPIFRYMAPLWTEHACLHCHATQGYREGDLRGGISVTIPAKPFLQLVREGLFQTAMGYGTVWLIGMVALLWAGQKLRTERRRLIRSTESLQRSLAEIRQLQGILPICASCKKIRNDQGIWEQIEAYVTNHSDAMFSHSVCPDCMKKLYPVHYAKRRGKDHPPDNV